MTVGVRLIRVSTRRTGERVTVRVYVYEQLEELRAAATRFSPAEDNFDDCMGVCQTATWSDDAGVVVDRTAILVRLWRGALGTSIVTHEMSHAACEVYARSLPDLDAPVGEHLHNANEVLAHLHSDLNRALIARLYAYGYYGTP